MATRRRKPLPKIDPQQMRAVMTPLMRVVASCCVAVCLYVCARELANAATRDPRFRVDAALQFDAGLPQWVPPQIAARIEADVRQVPALSMFDPQLVPKLKAALLTASPFISAVHRVQRVFPDRVALDLELDRPLLAFNDVSGRYYLNRRGLVLFRDDGDDRVHFDYPVLEVLGVRPQSRPVVGRPIDDERIVTAAQVAGELSELPDSFAAMFWALKPLALDMQVAIDAGKKNIGKNEVFIRLDASPVLVRYGIPAAARFGLAEPPVAQKMTHLRQLVGMFPNLQGLDEAWLNMDEPKFKQSGSDLFGWVASDYLPSEH